MDYPFPQFEHGAIYIDADLKCAETFVVFARDTTAKERAWIEQECPEPVRSFTWAERFAYFGSAGDTFDFDVTNSYGGDAVAALREAKDWGGVMEHIPAAMVAFVAAYDAWLEKVHAKVPIAFARAAGPTDPDEWAEWSAARADDALAALRATREAHGWLAEPAAGDAPKPASRLAPRARAAKCFGWIERAVSELAASAPVDPARAGARLGAVVEQLDALALPLPLERLSYTEHDLHTRGQAFAKVLDAMDGKARSKAIAKLSPRARLVYYASYQALDNGDLAAAGRDLAAALAAIADAMPADQQWTAAALLAFIAGNLAHITPAFDRPDKQRAKAALAVFRAAIDRGARCAEELGAAMTCAKVAGNEKALVDIATRAIDATRDVTVAKEAARLARALKDAKAAKRFADRAKAIAKSSKVAQDRELPVAKLVAHLDAGGEPTTDLVGNLAIRFDASADRTVVAAHVDRLATQLLGEPAYGLHPDVALNFCVMAGNHGFGARAIDVIDQLLDRGLRLNDQLGLSFSYAATVATKRAAKKKVLARLAGADDAGSPLTHSNLALVHLQLGNKPAALAALRRARELGHPTFAELRRDADFAPLHGDRQFAALFA